MFVASIKPFKLCVLVLTLAVTGCASSLKDVADPNAPTMKDIYQEYTSTDDQQMLERQTTLQRRPAMHEPDLQLGLPPYPERLDHLYPRLPNPDLFMYVRPHAVGVSGAPIPAYITRFTMYERQPYALPGETLESLRTDNTYRTDVIAEQQELAKADEKPSRSKSTRKGSYRK